MTSVSNWTKPMCIDSCNTNPKFNPTLSAGSVRGIGLRDPIQAIGVRQPGMGKKIIFHGI